MKVGQGDEYLTQVAHQVWRTYERLNDQTNGRTKERANELANDIRGSHRVSLNKQTFREEHRGAVHTAEARTTCFAQRQGNLSLDKPLDLHLLVVGRMEVIYLNEHLCPREKKMGLGWTNNYKTMQLWLDVSLGKKESDH